MDVENVFSNLARARNERSEIVPTSAWCCWRATHNECIVLLALFARSLVASHSSFLTQVSLTLIAKKNKKMKEAITCRPNATAKRGESSNCINFPVSMFASTTQLSSSRVSCAERSEARIYLAQMKRASKNNEKNNSVMVAAMYSNFARARSEQRAKQASHN